jgi:hypothetical protein
MQHRRKADIFQDCHQEETKMNIHPQSIKVIDVIDGFKDGGETGGVVAYHGLLNEDRRRSQALPRSGRGPRRLFGSALRIRRRPFKVEALEDLETRRLISLASSMASRRPGRLFRRPSCPTVFAARKKTSFGVFFFQESGLLSSETGVSFVSLRLVFSAF